MWRVSIHAPKDSLLDESFFAAKAVFYCWPYAPSLIHVVSASAARRWRVERGEYSGTGPAIPPHLLRGARIVASVSCESQEEARGHKFILDQFSCKYI